MAQTNYTPISLYYSTTASTAPIAGNLVSGELAINITDGKLFYKDNAGAVQTLATKLSTSGSFSTLTATAATTASSNLGAFRYGTLSFSDTGIVQSAQTSVNSYFQNVMQNTSAGAAASAEFIAYNDQGTASTNYATVGINSSGYSGTGSINAAGYGYFLTASTDLVLGTIGANGIHFTTNSSATDALAISSTGVISIPSSGTINGVAYLNGSKQLTTGSALVFDGANLGVGTSSVTAGFKLDVQAARALSLLKSTTGTNDVFQRLNNSGGNFTLGIDDSAGSNQTGSAYASYLWSSANSPLILATNNAAVATFSAAGNLGLGIPPSAWNTTSKALQIGQTGVLSGLTGANYVEVGNNFYRDSVGTYRYIQTAAANKIEFQTDGSYRWNQAPSGTAGNAITFTQAMTLDASGNWVIGQTSPYNPVGASMISATINGSTYGTLYVQANGGAVRGTFNATTANNTVNLNALTNHPLTFSTNDTERARIDSSGNFQVGITTYASSGIQIKKQYGGVNLSGGGGSWANWGGEYGMFPYAGVGLGIATAASIGFVGSTGSQIASINGTTGVYTPLSDAAKKKDFEDSSIGLAEILQLKPTLFRMIDDANDAPKQLGFIAQEVKLFIPQAYVENEIAEDQTFIGLQDRPIVAALVKAIQEQQALITSLTARITALESK